MKKLLTAIIAVLFAAPSFAQFSSGGFTLDGSTVYYGLRLGGTLASIGGDLGDEIDMGSKGGMTLGGVIGLRVSDTTPIFLESGLYYTERGAKDGKRKVGLTYLELPVLIKYGLQLNDDIALLPHLGPYFSYGIAGRFKDKEKLGISESSYKNSFRHFDMGFKLGCGIEYNMLYAELGYQFGIANIARDNDQDLDAKGRALYLNLGVNF